MIGPGQDIIQAKKRNLTPVLMAGGIILLGLTVLPYFIFNQPLNNPPLMAISKTAPATATSRPSPTSLSSGAPAPLATPIELTPPLLAPAEMPTLSSLPPTLTPTPPATATPPPVPTSTPSLPPTPTATPLVARVTGQIYLRWGPNREYGLAGHLSPGEEVTVLGRASNGFGLKVRKSNGQEGWITALNYLQLPLALEEITVVPVPALPRINPAGEAAPLALRQRSAFGRIPAGGDQEFEFRETQVETVFVLMFEPNVNLNKVSRVEFGIYSKNSAGVAEFVGVGSHPASDLDGDLSRGDLVWRGGPLVPNSPYFIRIINNSPETITYCLASRDVLQWTCP